MAGRADDHLFFAVFRRNRAFRLNVAAVAAGLRRSWQLTNDQVVEGATNAQTRGLVELDAGVITLTPRGRRLLSEQ